MAIWGAEEERRWKVRDFDGNKLIVPRMIESPPVPKVPAGFHRPKPKGKKDDR